MQSYSNIWQNACLLQEKSKLLANISYFTPIFSKLAAMSYVTARCCVRFVIKIMRTRYSTARKDMDKTAKEIIIIWCTPISHLVYTKTKFSVHQMKTILYSSSAISKQCSATIFSTATCISSTCSWVRDARRNLTYLRI